MKILLLAFFLSGCASGGDGGWRMPESDDSGNRAPGAAYAADGAFFRKDMPHRDSSTPWEFYYKHCSINGNESVYRNSYDCTGPSF